MSSAGMGDLLKQAQKLQQKINETQEGLSKLRTEGSAGGGMVSVVVNGKQEILEVRLEKEVVDPDDIEMLEDLIVAAVNQAIKNAQETANSEMNKAAGGMLGNLPGGFKIPGL